LRAFFAEYIFWSASINKPIGNIITNPGTKYQRVLVYKKPAGQGEDVTVNSYEKTNG
jgi:hypothetical protein